MFLKTKNKADGSEINIMIENIVSFSPSNPEDKTAGSSVLTTSGVSFAVEMSCQSIRSAIKKQYGGGSSED